MRFPSVGWIVAWILTLMSSRQLPLSFRISLRVGEDACESARGSDDFAPRLQVLRYCSFQHAFQRSALLFTNRNQRLNQLPIDVGPDIRLHKISVIHDFSRVDVCSAWAGLF